MQMKSVILERMGNERQFMQFCGVIRDLIIVSFTSVVAWLEAKESGGNVVGFVGF